MDEQSLARAGAAIGEDMRFQRKMWRTERIAWFVMAAALVAACTGLFGNGPWSHAESASADGRLRVRHERVMRWGAEYEFEILSGPNILRLDRALSAALRLDQTPVGARVVRVTPRVRIALVSGALLDAEGTEVPIRFVVLP